ncbi:MAG TPA: nuclear transport factor 2 family protein [Ohtaekwangia sp.]
MRSILTIVLLQWGSGLIATAQTTTQNLIDDTNRKIDQAVVDRDFAKLSQFYAEDFVFTHGTGVVDSKESWLADIQKSQDKFVSRTHDSTQVELHGDVAIVNGRLLVTKEKGAKYGLWYVRVFAKRQEKWLLISHRTVKEWHY